MHQLGLAVMYEPETGMSGGAMVATDGAWNYSDEQMEPCTAKRVAWIMHRIPGEIPAPIKLKISS
ncbi:gp92 [Escherichia phage Wphi]|uniref:Gp92 n=1 Tax=Escherichia phage Wphi TaxID=2681595 RepID=Q7Y4B6_9CAUD|nr:gp92 [Escherichia phage Wphi]AAN28259.1 gp92 [Escherichia phage Wphi]